MNVQDGAEDYISYYTDTIQLYIEQSNIISLLQKYNDEYIVVIYFLWCGNYVNDGHTVPAENKTLSSWGCRQLPGTFSS